MNRTPPLPLPHHLPWVYHVFGPDEPPVLVAALRRLFVASRDAVHDGVRVGVGGATDPQVQGPGLDDHNRRALDNLTRKGMLVYARVGPEANS